jgi:hypothetical protein
LRKRFWIGTVLNADETAVSREGLIGSITMSRGTRSFIK